MSILNKKTVLTCPSCGSHSVCLTGINWQCNSCTSFTCGNIWDNNSIAFNARQLGVSEKQYREISKRQGNNLDLYMEKLEEHKNKLRAMGLDG